MKTLRSPRCKLLHLILALNIGLVFPTQAFAWGDKAHQIIGALAWLKLSEASKRQVKALLPEGNLDPNGNLAFVAPWADRQRAVYTEQQSWHQVDIPLSALTYNWERDCADDNCIVYQLNEKKNAILSGKDKKTRAEALKYVVHLVGDVYQPLHCADNNDRGGNMVQVKFLGKISTLHKVWDFDMIEASRLSVADYARKLSPLEVKKWYWIEDWVNDSHAVARQYVYAIPKDRELGTTYYRRNLPILETQLATAADKLVLILEEVFKTQPQKTKAGK